MAQEVAMLHAVPLCCLVEKKIPHTLVLKIKGETLRMCVSVCSWLNNKKTKSLNCYLLLIRFPGICQLR